jgi:uncharacterized protein (TIGR02217 family)
MPQLEAFHDVRFPLRLSFGASGGPQRDTEIITLQSGRERRNARAARSRRRYDVASAIRTLDDMHTVIAFFEARRGEFHAFRFRDPFDWKSCLPSATPSATDQTIGTGDGVATVFQLAKSYGDAAQSVVRPITKPVADTVVVAVDGAVLSVNAVSVDVTSGAITLGAAPPNGATITAGFEFDTPVRFATANLDSRLSAFNAASVPSIPLIEVLA